MRLPPTTTFPAPFRGGSSTTTSGGSTGSSARDDGLDPARHPDDLRQVGQVTPAVLHGSRGRLHDQHGTGDADLFGQHGREEADTAVEVPRRARRAVQAAHSPTTAASVSAAAGWTCQKPSASTRQVRPAASSTASPLPVLRGPHRHHAAAARPRSDLAEVRRHRGVPGDRQLGVGRHSRPTTGSTRARARRSRSGRPGSRRGCGAARKPGLPSRPTAIRIRVRQPQRPAGQLLDRPRPSRSSASRRQLLGHDGGLQLALRRPARRAASRSRRTCRARRTDTAARPGPATARGSPPRPRGRTSRRCPRCTDDDDPLAGQRVPHEHHAALVPRDAVPAVRDRADLDLEVCEPVGSSVTAVLSFSPVACPLLSSPRRTAPGATTSLSRTLVDDASCHGTLVTITPGWNSSLPLSRNALWLCRNCSHQWPTTYSGMNTVTTSRGLSRAHPLHVVEHRLGDLPVRRLDHLQRDLESPPSPTSRHELAGVARRPR